MGAKEVSDIPMLPFLSAPPNKEQLEGKSAVLARHSLSAYGVPGSVLGSDRRAGQGDQNCRQCPLCRFLALGATKIIRGADSRGVPSPPRALGYVLEEHFLI